MTAAARDRLGIVAIDGSSESIEMVRFVADTFHPSWNWLIAHVVDLAAPAHPDAVDQLAASASEVVDRAGQHLPGASGIIERSSNVADGLRTIARDHDAVLLVVGSGDRGRLTSALLGSVSAELIHESPCPVLTFSDPTA